MSEHTPGLQRCLDTCTHDRGWYLPEHVSRCELEPGHEGEHRTTYDTGVFYWHEREKEQPGE